jgi:Tfp pilus assembly protein PilN
MRPVNLIPPEDRRGERAPLRAGPLAYVVVGVLLLAFVGIYMLVSVGNSISEREAEVAGLQQQLDSSKARADALQSFSAFASMEQGRTETVSSLAHSRFDWERVLRELALVVPEEVSLVDLSGAVAGAASAESDADATNGGAEIDAPTLTMSGCASDHESVAQMVSALRDIDGVTRVGLSNSTAAGGASAVGGESTAAPSAAGAADGAGCTGAKSTTFHLTVAFDEVAVDPATGGVAPPLETAPTADDGSGVTEAAQERAEAKGSVDSAQKRSDDAVNDLVPGA